MRFGGHETFTVREGWLTKGLRILHDDPQKLVEEFAEDNLGVGRNMVKSIRHWLVATGLAEIQSKTKGRANAFAPSPLGEAIYKNDPYMLDLGTWWILHLNLIGNESHAAAWYWFFNEFSLNRFERPVCIETLNRHLRLCQKRVPSPRTIEREIACLFNSYAVTVPRSQNDPEDASDCPFSELGLLNHFKASGYYQINQGEKNISHSILALALVLSNQYAKGKRGFYEIALTLAARQRGGPGRGFQLTAEGLFEMLMRYEEKDKNRDLQVIGMAGERVIRMRRRSSLDWVNEYYSNGKKIQKIA